MQIELPRPAGVNSTSSSKRISSSIFIRLMVGAVFVEAGLQKILFPETQGAGRFVSLGFPAPAFLAMCIAALEIGAGLAVLIGYRLRLATIPLVAIMVVALFATKLPLVGREGWIAAIHAARLDYAMLLGSLYLMFNGSSTTPPGGLARRRREAIRA